jgi:hypothetical protein
MEVAMTVTRLAWIVVAVLLVVSAFVGGVAIGNWNAQRSAFAGYGMGPGMMRGLAPSGRFAPTAPYTSTMPFGYGRGNGLVPRNGRGYGMMPRNNRSNGMPPALGRGNRMMPGYGRGYGVVPNTRGGQKQMPTNRGTIKPNDRRMPGRGRGW